MKIKKVIFMLRKLLRDFNTNRKIEINMDNQSETLGYYYIKFDEDIAKLLCPPSEFKRKRNGGLPPNSREEWLDVQARALAQGLWRVFRIALNLGRAA